MGTRIEIHECAYQEILPLRKPYLQECNCQIRYDACHWRGWSTSFLIKLDKQIIGYDALKGLNELKDRDTRFECYLLADYREYSADALNALILKTGAKYMEAQTNDPFTSELLYKVCEHIA